MPVRHPWRILKQLLNLGSIHLPLNAATKTFAILAKRGAGKSYTGAVMAEEFHKHHIPFVVFDPIDVWWGLRLAKNGTEKGLPVVVFGLEHADIPLERDMGREIARAIVQDNVSCVLSTFGLPKVAQRHLIAEFAEEMLNSNNLPRHIFVEEAHEFIPQRVSGALGKTFNAVSNLVVMGRNRGIGVTLINQRAATINKDVLTQLDTLLAFRNVAPQDRKALKEWVEYHAAAGDFDQFMQSLPSLPTGEGWIWSPEFLGLFERLTIRERETFHPDREKIGDRFVMPTLEQIDIQQFIERFSKRDGQHKPSHSPKRVEAVEPAVPSEEQILHHPLVVAMRTDYESQLMQKDMDIRRREDMLEHIRRIVGGSAPSGTPSSVLVNSVSSNAAMWIEKLGNGGASRILRFLADKSGLKFTRSQIALAVGLAPKSGSYASYIATLKRNRLIIEQKREIWINPDL